MKKSRKPAPPVKYLLSGDRRLQRLSLKKISERAKNAKPRGRAPRVKPAAIGKVATPGPWPIGGRVIVVGVVCLLAAAALLTARQPAAQPDDVSAGLAQDTPPSPQPARLTAAAAMSTTIPPTRSVTPAPAGRVAPAPVERTAVAAPVKTAAAPVKTAEAPPKAAAAPVKTEERTKVTSSSTVARESTEPTDEALRTVEGCLEFDKPGYRLKNASGLDAPRTRSWRSGFLMKRSSSIELVDARGTLKLTDHVGQRVAVTGSLVNREMQARTLREVAASCR